MLRAPKVDPDLVPFEPPAEPLGTLGIIRGFITNPIETFPRECYTGGVVEVGTGRRRAYLVTDPELIGEILLAKTEIYHRAAITHRATGPLIGERSLFLAEGADWRWQRRAVAPPFRPEALRASVPAMAQVAEATARRWRDLPAGQPFDVAHEMMLTTFEALLATLLSGFQGISPQHFGQAITDFIDTIGWRSLYAAFGVPEWMPFPGILKSLAAKRYLASTLERAIAAHPLRTGADATLLDQVLGARDPETGRAATLPEQVGGLLTFLVAGHETTAIALTWALWLVARDPVVQQRLREEIESVVGSGPVTAAALDDLVYTRQVLQEAMRLYPPAHTLPRQAVTQDMLGPVPVIPGMPVHIPVFALHRHEHLWTDPLTFNPDRFAPEIHKNRSRYSYLPFGGGPRICVGASFAMMEAAVILATLVRDYALAPVRGHVPRPLARLTLRPQGGLPLYATPRR